MDILILIAIIAVGASGLYVAFMFNTRTEKSITKHVHPLIEDKAKDISDRISASAEREKTQAAELMDLIRSVASQHRGEIMSELGEQAQKITDELRNATRSELRQQIQKITGELEQERALVKRLADELGTRQDQLGKNLAHMDDRVAQLGESLAWQGSQLADIHRHTKGQVDQTGFSPEMVPLALAMLEAESHADHMGWGTPPQLYTLTTTISLVTADHRLKAEMRYGRPDRLILAAHEPLPDGDLMEALVNIRWPEDVAGCVLVTSLTDLPARSEGDVPVDSGAAGQWAHPHPDGRPARLAVGVRKSGEHICTLRVKGEPDVQIRNEVAGDIVAALLGTF